MVFLKIVSILIKWFKIYDDFNFVRIFAESFQQW